MWGSHHIHVSLFWVNTSLTLSNYYHTNSAFFSAWCNEMVYAMFNNLVSMTEPVYTYVEEIAFQLFWVSLILCLRNHQRKPCAHVAFNWTWFWALNSQRATYIHILIAISFVFFCIIPSRVTIRMEFHSWESYSNSCGRIFLYETYFCTLFSLILPFFNIFSTLRTLQICFIYQMNFPVCHNYTRF